MTPIGVDMKIRGDLFYREADSQCRLYGTVSRVSASLVASGGLHDRPLGLFAGGVLATAIGLLLYKINEHV